MKSAYEIAMERLEKESGPTKRLSDAQKAEIARIEKKYEAKIAERKVVYDAEIVQAGSLEEMESTKGKFAEDIAALEAERDKAKEAVWNAE